MGGGGKAFAIGERGQGKCGAILGWSRVDSSAKGISDGISVEGATRGLIGEDRTTILSVDASACEGGRLLRAGVGKTKHLSRKHL